MTVAESTGVITIFKKSLFYTDLVKLIIIVTRHIILFLLLFRKKNMRK